MAASKTQIPLKVVIHKQEGRILFAEANSEFVDVLLSFLTMPMGTIVRLLSKHCNTFEAPAIGSLNKLYGSIADLDDEYFATKACRDVLLHTRNSAEAECQSLRIKIDDIKPIEYFTCEDMNCTANSYTSFFSMHNGVQCKNCSKFLKRKACLCSSGPVKGEGVFVQQTESFIITNDLCVLPNIPASTLAILEDSGSPDFRVLEEKTFQIGHPEILDLLKYSLVSKTPLTNMLLNKNNIILHKS